MEFLYIFPICAACSVQSSGLSWIIHKESIHRYRYPNFRVIKQASLNTAGRSPISIPFTREGIDASSVFRGAKSGCPQHQLRAIHSPRSPGSEMCNFCVVVVEVPRSRTRFGRNDIPGVEFLHSRWVFWQFSSHFLLSSRHASESPRSLNRRPGKRSDISLPR